MWVSRTIFPFVILSVAKDQVGRRESSTYRMMVKKGTVVP